MLLLLQAQHGLRDIGVTGVQTCFFFFSSRRRHTRYWRDWSSDCALPISLGLLQADAGAVGVVRGHTVAGVCLKQTEGHERRLRASPVDSWGVEANRFARSPVRGEIDRKSVV